MRVTNAHHAPLTVGGKTIRPGGSIDLPRKALAMAKTNSTVAAWFEAGLLVEGNGQDAQDAAEQADDRPKRAAKTEG